MSRDLLLGLCEEFDELDFFRAVSDAATLEKVRGRATVRANDPSVPEKLF